MQEQNIGINEMTQQDLSIRDQIKAIVDTSSMSFAQIARETSLSSGTISTWINNKYQGNNEQIDKTLSAWLENHQQRSELPEPPRFVMTPTAKQVWTTCRYAQTTESIAVVCGNPGVGKTKAASEYVKEQPSAWMITITPSCASVLECLTELAYELGINDIPRRKGPLSRAIRRRLINSNGVVVVDEADHLDREALEELRALQDATAVGLVLMGNDRVYTKMSGNRSVEFARLFSRISKRTAIRKTKVADVNAIADAWHIEAESDRAILHKIAQKPGALRILSHTLRLAAMTAHGNGQRVNGEFITKAFKDLDLDVDVSSVLSGKA